MTEKRKYGFGLPFVVWLREELRLHELVQDMIRKVRTHGWIRNKFLDDLTQVHLHDHPSYYGEFVWVLVALGIWLEHHEARIAGISMFLRQNDRRA